MSKKNELDMRQNMRKKFPLYSLFYLHAVKCIKKNRNWKCVKMCGRRLNVRNLANFFMQHRVDQDEQKL